jgi:alpha-glucosidase (family GH31 glycosyl hydrolase)
MNNAILVTQFKNFGPSSSSSLSGIDISNSIDFGKGNSHGDDYGNDILDFDSSSSSSSSSSLCFIDPLLRKECGVHGITREQCLNMGCCWNEIEDANNDNDNNDNDNNDNDNNDNDNNDNDNNDNNNDNENDILSHIPWCYHQKNVDSTSTKKSIKTSSYSIKNTLTPSIKATTTTNIKTNSISSKPNSTHTIKSKKNCVINENQRRECGYLGITKNECEAGGCCWEESNSHEIPWCFNELGKSIQIEKEPITVRFLKPEEWSTVNLWAWDANGNNLYGDQWPGKPIHDLHNGWVSHTFPKNIGSVHLLFNDNGREKTKDIHDITKSTCLKLYRNEILHTVDCNLNLSVCKISAESRIQCGSKDISEDECLDLNCCYQPTNKLLNTTTITSVPSCYYSIDAPINNKANGSCNIMNPFQRTPCGGSSDDPMNHPLNETECKKMGCCYHELSNDPSYTNTTTFTPIPSCFNHGPGVPSCIVDETDRERCGYEGISQEDCKIQRCCYDSVRNQCFKKGIKSVIDKGDCVYTVTKLKSSDSGIKAVLDLKDKICQKYDIDFQTLDFEAKFETDTRLHIHIQPTDIENYPHNTDIPKNAYPFEIENESHQNLQYSYHLEEGQNFQLKVKRSDGSLLFDGISFIFERQYLEISKKLNPNSSIYGFGEVLAPYRRNNQETQHALFNTDNATPIGQNLYGSHPFYIELMDGKAYGFFLKNSHGMDFSITKKDANIDVMTIQIIGGNFDMYFFMGPSMEEVVKQYYKVIGAPALLPYWALGWHQCRYGYKTIWEVEMVVENYRKNAIPLDTMWIDIDFMDHYKDFTYDSERFPVSEVRKFVKSLKKNHQYYVNMIDPAIAIDERYGPYRRGIEKDIFIKDFTGKNYFVGEVWPGQTVFPDWHHPDILDYWTNEIRRFKNLAMTDGHWIDMNEAANFCDGACRDDNDNDNDNGNNWDPPFNLGEFNPRVPPFSINHFGQKAPLKTKNLDMDATYYGGLIDYDIHNIYGHMEAIITNKALLSIDPKKRPFLLSRSTFPGTGQYAAHWLGDNHSDWEHLYYSIPGMLNFQLFGIPMVGSDVCGFVFDSNEELCARWMELGAFNPFARNHNGLGYRDQEPYVWPLVAEASRRALSIRYKIMPYLYTLLVRTHTHSEMILYSFAMEWPHDANAIAIDKQFLVGKGILITPVIEKGATSVIGYFPEGIWYDWYTHDSLIGPTFKTLAAELVHIPVHLRGGYIIPTQGPSLTIYDNRKKPFELLIALDHNGKAKGRLYLDDGISIQVGQQFSEIEYSVENGTLIGKGFYHYHEIQKLQEVTILGMHNPPMKVIVNNQESPFKFFNSTLVIDNLNLSMNHDFIITCKK